MQIRLSDMQVGDYATMRGMLVRLMDGGKAGGCEHDLRLAYQGELSHPDTATWCDVPLDTLPEVVIDRQDVSI